MQDTAIITMVDQYKVIDYPSNRTIFNELERPQTQILRSSRSLMLNISAMAKDTALVAMEGA